MGKRDFCLGSISDGNPLLQQLALKSTDTSTCRCTKVYPIGPHEFCYLGIYTMLSQASVDKIAARQQKGANVYDVSVYIYFVKRCNSHG